MNLYVLTSHRVCRRLTFLLELETKVLAARSEHLPRSALEAGQIVHIVLLKFSSKHEDAVCVVRIIITGIV